jgi:hypothetical protein
MVRAAPTGYDFTHFIVEYFYPAMCCTFMPEYKVIHCTHPHAHPTAVGMEAHALKSYTVEFKNEASGHGKIGWDFG